MGKRKEKVFHEILLLKRKQDCLHCNEYLRELLFPPFSPGAEKEVSSFTVSSF